VFGIPSAQADVSLPRIFTDHAVLQRDMAVPVWGTAEPGEKVTVKLGDAQATATADAQGKWSVKLPAMKTNATGQDLTVSGKNTVTVKDVLIGDVWVCGGQSNMEWGLGGCNAREDIAAADCPTLRRIKIKHRALPKPASDVEGQWAVCTPNTAGGITAVGFYFARRIQKETGVPIGLIDDNIGGTRIEPWTPAEGFALEPTLAQIPAGVKEPVNNGTPMALYNAMINPVVPYGIKGAIWYQGESNGGEGESYYHKMRALVNGWRKVWNQGDFSFYFVQLANWQKPNDNPAGGDGWAKVRMAQVQSLQIPNTGMAVTIDIGEAGDIHPKNKFDVGERLALWALRDNYGKKDLVVSGPLYKSMKVEGNKIRLSFDHVGGGLMVGKKDGRNPTVEDKSGKLARFAVAGEDKKWVWAEAVIDGPTVVVSSPDVAQPVAVRYAFSMNPEGCNLYNKDGLPASPFRTDEW
jgi:sialate O-acetylesterase